MEIGEREWSDETRKLEDKAFWAKVRDIIRNTFDKKIFLSWIEKMKEASETKIEKPKEAIDNVVKYAQLTEEQKNILLMQCGLRIISIRGLTAVDIARWLGLY